MLSKIKLFIQATRPASLFISAVPVSMATVMAWGDGGLHIPAALAALFGAILIHAGCNITNDYWDLIRGSDQVGKVDPMRGFAVGDITPQELKKKALVVFILALLPTFYLIQRGGMPLMVIAFTAFLSAIFYTAGKRSLAYLGMGEIFAFSFFGPIALAGTYFVQSREMNAAVVLSGVAPGLVAVAILVINNIRDWEQDQRVKKLTLAVRWGKRFAYYEFLVAIFGIVLMPVLIFGITYDHALTLFATGCGFLALPIILKVLQAKEEMDFNQAIGGMIVLLIIYAVVFSIGWIF